MAQTWQVLRSETDEMLLNNAREKGAEVKEETTVNELIWETSTSPACALRQNGAVTEYRAPITLDARAEAFCAVRNGWRAETVSQQSPSGPTIKAPNAIRNR